jgi:hypothetical protein
MPRQRTSAGVPGVPGALVSIVGSEACFLLGSYRAGGERSSKMDRTSGARGKEHAKRNASVCGYRHRGSGNRRSEWL